MSLMLISVTKVLIHGEAAPTSQIGTLVNDDDQPASAGANLYDPHLKTRTTTNGLSSHPWASTAPEWPPRKSDGRPGGYFKGKGDFYNNQEHSDMEIDNAFAPDFETDEPYPVVPQLERKRLAKMEQRTILVKNLSDRAKHQDIVDLVRGGLILDIYLRSHERSASISFVEGSAAQDFMKDVRRNDIYVHGKRLDFSWSDRQYVLPSHVANKIGIGATRNLVIRGTHEGITEELIRNHLDHIHNIVIVNLRFEAGDAYVSLNSINNSLFARTCMMSRATYKGMRIEWCPDECSQPLPKLRHAPKKENLAPPRPKKLFSAMNRFQMLNLDGAEDASDGTDEEPTVLSDLSATDVSSHKSPWNARTVAA